jgi:hypothetical protein
MSFGKKKRKNEKERTQDYADGQIREKSKE